MEQSEIVQLSARGVVLSVVSVLMSTEGMVRVHLPSVEAYWKQSGIAKQIKGKGRGFFEKRRAVYVKKVPKYDVGGHETDANWAANESFEISKFKFKFPRESSNFRTFQGSFSAVSKPNFARKYALESSRRDLQNALLCNVLVGSVWVKKYTKINFEKMNVL